MSTHTLAIYSFPLGWKFVLATLCIVLLLWVINYKFRFIAKLAELRRRPLLLFLFYFFMVLALKWPVLNVPYGRSDITGYILPAAEWALAHNFLPPTGSVCMGHPPFLYEVLAVSFAVTGSTEPWVSHLVVIVFAAVGLFFTHLLAQHLVNGRAALLATVLLFFSDTYFHGANGPFFGIPLAALSIMTLYFAVRQRFRLYLVSATLLVLCKIPGVLIIPGIVCYIFMREKKQGRPFSRIFFTVARYSLPCLVAAGWVVVLRLTVGAFVSENHEFFHIAYKDNLQAFFHLLSLLFYTDYKWILTAFVICSIPVRPREWLHIDFAAFYLIILTFCVFFSFWAYHFHRYLLPVYPLLFILFGKAVYDILKNRAWIVLVIMGAILFTKDYDRPEHFRMPWVKKKKAEWTIQKEESMTGPGYKTRPSAGIIAIDF